MDWFPSTFFESVSGKEICSLLSSQVRGISGDLSISCHKFRPADLASSGSLIFCNKGPSVFLAGIPNLVILCPSSLRNEVESVPFSLLIFVDNPKYSFSFLCKTLSPSIKQDPVIGEGTEIFPSTTIYPNVRIGRNTIIHAECSIGHPGLGLIQGPNGQEQFHDIGGVEIGEDVYIGAGTMIARSPISNTMISNSVKIGNSVNIGHNALIERKVVIASKACIGRGIIRKRAFIGMGAVVLPGVVIGERAIVGMGAVVLQNVPPNVTVVGNPARRIDGVI